MIVKVLGMWYNLTTQMGELRSFGKGAETTDGGRTLGAFPQSTNNVSCSNKQLKDYPCRLVCGILLAITLAGCNQSQALNLQSLTTGPASTTRVLPTPVSGAEPTGVSTQIGSLPTIADVTIVVPPTAPVEPVATQPPPTAPATAVPTEVVVAPISGEAAWNAQKTDVVEFEGPRNVLAPGNVQLWWYDPASGQHVGLGWLQSPFAASSQFRFRWSGLAAMAVPFRVAGDYGITLEQSVIDRIRRVGYAGEQIETFVYLAPDMTIQ